MNTKVFIKDNLARIALAVAGIIGVVFSIILLTSVVKDESLGEFANSIYLSNLLFYTTQLLFFISLTTYLILRMFDSTKHIAPYVLLSIAVVCFVMLTLSLITTIEYVKHATTQIENNFNLAKTLPDNTIISEIGNITKESFVNKLKVWQNAITISVYSKLTNILIFAIAPLIYSFKKLTKNQINFI